MSVSSGYIRSSRQIMQGGYNRRDYLDDKGGPGAGRLEPLVQNARAHTEEHAQTLARLCHTVHLGISRLHTHACIQ